MARNPIEANPVTRFLLGLAVVFAMILGANLVTQLFVALGIPYPAWIGTGTGAIVVFGAFTVLYRRYDAAAPRFVEQESS